MILILSPQAEIDIEEIGDYIAKNNPNRALTFIDELYNKCKFIAAQPHIYQYRPELGNNIRLCPFGHYTIAFSTYTTQTRIERVLHGSRLLTEYL